MELAALASFVAVAEESSFVRAAQRVHLGQPAVSQHVRRLESTLGVRLFTRTSRHVALTDEGRALLPAAREVLAAAARLTALAGDVERGARRRLRLGTSTALGPRLAMVLAELARRAPGLQVDLERLRLTERLDAVRAGRLDAAFAQALERASGLEVVAAWDEPLLAALPGTHPLCDFGEVELRQLGTLPVRLAPRRSNPPFRDAMERLLEPLADVPRGPRFTRLEDVLAEIGAGRAGWTPLYGDVPDVAGVAYRPVAGQRVGTGLAVLPGPPTVAVRLLLQGVAAVAAATAPRS